MLLREQHHRHTQISVCGPRLQVLWHDPWVEVLPPEVLPGDVGSLECQLYIGVEVTVQQHLPVLRRPHITIGRYQVRQRVNVNRLLHYLEQCFRWHQNAWVELRPYGRGYHWMLEPNCEAFRALSYCQWMLENRFGLHATWQPDLHGCLLTTNRFIIKILLFRVLY